MIFRFCVLGQMRPSLAMDNNVNLPVINSGNLCDFCLRNTLRPESAHLQNKSIGEPCVGVPFTVLLPRTVAAFGVPVGIVFALSAKPKVIRIGATAIGDVSSWIVHITRVANIYAIWNGADVKLVRKAMGENIALIEDKETVATSAEQSAPQPALVKRTGIRPLPKAFFWGHLEIERKSCLVSGKEKRWLTGNRSGSLIRGFCNWCWLTAAAAAQAGWGRAGDWGLSSLDFLQGSLRGRITLHQKLRFWCLMPGAVTSSRPAFLCNLLL